MSLEVRDIVSGYTREVPVLKGSRAMVWSP